MRDFTSKSKESLLSKSLEEIAREGARRMLEIALESEITDFIDQQGLIRDSQGRRQITRNGYHPRRKVATGIGEIEVRVPRSRDHRQGHLGQICYQIFSLSNLLYRSSCRL